MWHRASLISFYFAIVIILQSCVVSVPIGGGNQGEGSAEEIIIQTEARYLKELSKAYSYIGWSYQRTLSEHAGMYLIVIYPGKRDHDLVMSDIQRDARIQQAEWNKPTFVR